MTVIAGAQHGASLIICAFAAASNPAKNLVEIDAVSGIREAVEFAFLDQEFGGAHEAAPGGAGEGTADADAAYTEFADLLKCEIARPAHEQVHGLRRDAGDDRPDLIRRSDSRGVEAIGTGIGVSLEPGDGVVEIRLSDQKALGAADQQRVAAGAVDGFARGANPLDGRVEIEERMRLLAGRVFDRQAGHPRLGGETHALDDAGRVGRETALEIGVDRQVGGFDQLGEVIEHPVARHRAVPMAVRPREAGTRRGQRLEALSLQIARTAHIPRVRDQEAAALVQSMERAPLVGDAGADVGHERILA